MGNVRFEVPHNILLREQMRGTIVLSVGPVTSAYTHSFASTNSALIKTVLIREFKNVRPSVMGQPRYTQILQEIRRFQENYFKPVREDIKNLGLDVYAIHFHKTDGVPVSCEDGSGTYTIKVDPRLVPWLDHMLTTKRVQAIKAMCKLKAKGIHNDIYDPKHERYNVKAKGFVKVEIAIRTVEKGPRPRLIQFLEPEIMVKAAPHAYLCYKVLKEHMKNPEHFYVNTSGKTYDDLSSLAWHMLVSVNECRNLYIDHNCKMCANGDDGLSFLNEHMFNSGPFIDGYTLWGRDPVIHIKGSIYLATYCSGWFVRWWNGTNYRPRFMLRPFKCLAKSMHAISNATITAKALRHVDYIPELITLLGEKFTSSYINSSGDPFLEPIFEAWLIKLDVVSKSFWNKFQREKKTWFNPRLKNDVQYRKDHLLKYANPWTIMGDGAIYKRCEISDEAIWWSYYINYGVSKHQLLNIQRAYIKAIVDCDIGSYVKFDNEILDQCIKTDLDAKNPQASSRPNGFGNEGDVIIIEADCGAYDSTTQRESLRHNVWLQELCFGNTYFTELIRWRSSINVQSRSRYQSCSWTTRNQMLSGYFDTSIGNGITNITEMTTSLLLSYGHRYQFSM